MFLSLTSSSNQMTVLGAAAKAKLVSREVELFEAVMTIVRTVAKERHRLAHWCWALSDDLPDALLLIDPADQAPLFANMLGYHDVSADIDRGNIFVLRKPGAQEILTKMNTVRLFVSELLRIFCKEDRGERFALLRTLSSEPQIHEALSRLRERQKNNPSPP
jgi:hypothetical protein